MEKDKFKIRKDKSLAEQIKHQVDFLLVMLNCGRVEYAKKSLNNITTLLEAVYEIENEKIWTPQGSNPPEHWSEHEELGT